MTTAVRVSDLGEIVHFRENYRAEMNCQITHDSIHGRAGWTREYVLQLAGSTVGYGSVAVSGPWSDTPALYEFFVEPEHRTRLFDLFADLLTVCEAKTIETQTNNRILTVMLHTFARNVRAESIVFEDSFLTSHAPPGAGFRATTSDDAESLRQQNLDDGARWVVTMNGEIAGAGGVLYHYNRPYGDVYMEIAKPFRLKGSERIWFRS